MNDTPQTQMTEGRQIRIFISSTFRDMQAERELLIKRVFPELRSICARRFVTFTEVDLRWGISEEQAAEGKVLPICLEEIRLSRPYFIGLLGERYGWIPQTMPPSVLTNEPWLEQHVGHRTSVTELEILHGVLNNPKMAGHAYFYFRDPKYLLTLPDDVRREMIERDIPEDVLAFGEAEAMRRTAERKARLAALKQRIRDSGLPLLEDYSNPEALAAAVRDNLLVLIEQLYPENATPDPLCQETLGHDRYAAHKLLAFVPRPTHTAVLDAFISDESTGQGLVVTGDSGGGKTALLADWVRHWRENHKNDFIFDHYFGATPYSASAPRFLRRLLGELKRRFDLQYEIPSEPDKLREALPLWLAQSTGKGQIILVLDALNQIEGDEPDRRLSWLPRHFSPHVRVLASALPGLALDAMLDRQWARHNLPPPDAAERGQMIDKFFQHYRKEPGTKLRNQLVAAPGSTNPLFLRTVLEELRQFGSFEQLPAKVAEYLTATTPRELFRLVLHRWQQDFDAGRDLVHRVLCYLWAARQGLSEIEWLELVGTMDEPLLRQIWSPLFLAMESHLTLRAGLHTFGHDFLRAAVHDQWLQDAETVRAFRLRLADYFAKIAEPTDRKLDELPWQWEKAEAWPQLHRCLIDLDLFQRLFDRNKYEIVSYWLGLSKQYEVTSSYEEAWQRWSGGRAQGVHLTGMANRLGLFFQETAHYQAAETFQRRALSIDEQVFGSDHPHVATDLNHLAYSLHTRGRLAEAEPLMRRALAIEERTFGPDDPRIAKDLNNLATLLHNLDRLNEAESLLRRALSIAERSGADPLSFAMQLINLAALLHTTNRLGEAEPLLRRGLEILESRLGANHPSVAVALGHLSQLLHTTNRLSEAEQLMHRSLSIQECSFGPHHPEVAAALYSLAQLLNETNRLTEAEPLMRRALAIEEQCLGPDHPDVAKNLCNLAGLLVATNRLWEAEPLLQRALAINEHWFGPQHTEVAVCLNSLSQLLLASNRLLEAEPLVRRALAITEQRLGSHHTDVASCLNNLAQLLKATNRLAEAEPLMRRALEIDGQSLGSRHPKVAVCLNNLAQLLQATNRLAEAEPLMRRALAIDEQSLGPDHPKVATCLNNLGQLLKATNRLVEAEPLLRRALTIKEMSLGLEHPEVAVALNNLANLLRATNRLAEAEPLIRRALAIDEKSLGPGHPNVALRLSNLAGLLSVKKRSAEAEALYRRALAIWEESFGPEYPDIALCLNELANLLGSTNRMAMAEPLLCRSVEILLKYTRASGYQHPRLETVIGNYAGLLHAMGHSRDEILARLNDLCRPFGVRFGA